MSEHMFGITYNKPSQRTAKQWDRICREAGGYGYTECNRKEGASPGINNGRYQGWFVGPNRGEPFDSRLANDVKNKIAWKEQLK